MPKKLQTEIIVQMQFADTSVKRLRANEDGSRVVLYVDHHEVILEKKTLERALRLLNQNQNQKESQS